MRETLISALVEASCVDGLGINFWDRPGESQFLSYEDLLDDARRVAFTLVERGLEHGDRVAIILPTEPDFYRAYFGIILAGGVPTALYPPMRLGRVDEWKARTTKMLEAASCVGLITNASLMWMCGEPVRASKPRMGCMNVAGLLETERTFQVALKPTDLAGVQFSSGSTGDPKAVALTHSNLLSNASSILSALPGDSRDHHCVSWLPLYHDMGLVGCMISAMVGQTPLTLIRPERFVAQPRLWLQAISEMKATISVAPNFAFGLATQRIKDAHLEGIDLSSWQVALCGAEPVHRNTLDAFVDRFSEYGFKGSAMTPVYGLAEATLAVTFSPLEEEPAWKAYDPKQLAEDRVAVVQEDGRMIASVGRPLPDVKLDIRDESGRSLGPKRVGEVWIHGPGVMAGYLDRPEVNARVFDEQGWLKSGDLGFIDDGELYLCGRAKDLIIINGRNHDPAPIEESLHGLIGVRTGCVAAFALRDSQKGTEGLGLVVETRLTDTEDLEALESAIKLRVQEQTGLRVQDLRLVPPGSIPRTSSGKVRRKETRERVMNGALSAPRSGRTSIIVAETLKGILSHARHRMATRRSSR